MHVRLATENDIDAMHRVRMSVRENQLSDAALVQPRHYRSILNSQGCGWVAEVDRRIVGFAMADLSRSNIWALFVEPGCEGRGIGRHLHGVMLDWLFAQGAQRIWLTTDPGTRAERFYRSAAWRFVGSEANGELRFEHSRDDWLVASLERVVNSGPCF